MGRLGLRAKLVVIAGSAVVGATMLLIAMRSRPEFETWLRSDPYGRMAVVLAGLAVVTSGPLLAMAFWLWRVGGTSDRRHFRGIAAALGVAAIALSFFLWRLGTLLRPQT